MNPDTRVKLTQGLQEMRSAGPAYGNPWLFRVGTIVECLFGVAMIGWSVQLTVKAVAEDRLFWLGYSIFLLGIVLLAHAVYLVSRRSMNEKLRVLYEAMLEMPPSIP
jgi:hypothetical protein